MAWLAVMQNVPPFGPVTQQAPTGVFDPAHGIGRHVESAPWNSPPIELQCNSVTTTHATPPPMQHAPVAGGAGSPQSPGRQSLPAPWNVPLNVSHCSCVTLTQWTEPLGVVMQHAPTSPPVPQSEGLQVVSDPWKTPLSAAHCAGVVI